MAKAVRLIEGHVGQRLLVRDTEYGFVEIHVLIIATDTLLNHLTVGAIKTNF